MNCKPIAHSERMKLARLYQELVRIRGILGVSEPGTRLNWLTYDDTTVITEADGFGCATLQWFESAGEDETLVYGSHVFDNEQEAHDAVEWLRHAVNAGTISMSEFFWQLEKGKQPYRILQAGPES